MKLFTISAMAFVLARAAEDVVVDVCTGTDGGGEVCTQFNVPSAKADYTPIPEGYAGRISRIGIGAHGDTASCSMPCPTDCEGEGGLTTAMLLIDEPCQSYPRGDLSEREYKQWWNVKEISCTWGYKGKKGDCDIK